MANRRNRESWETEKGIEKFREICEVNHTNRGISACLGISPSTLNTWLRQSEALKEVYDISLNKNISYVESSLYERAMGLESLEETQEPIRMTAKEYKERLAVEVDRFMRDHPDADELDIALFKMSVPKTRMMTTKVVRKKIVGDASSQQFYLTNRAPDEWKNRRNDTVQSVQVGLSSGEKKALVKEYIKDLVGKK